MNHVRRTREIVALAVIPSLIVMIISEGRMVELNPLGYGPWPPSLPRPISFEIWLWARNISLLSAIITGVVTFPRWPSIIGLTLTLVYAAFFYWTCATY